MGVKHRIDAATMHSFPYHNIISTFRCPEPEPAHILRRRWRRHHCCFFFSFFSLFFLNGDAGPAGEADAPICSVKQNDPLPRAPPSSACPPYRVTAVPKKGHCGRLRKRRKAVKGDGRVDAGAWNKVERWIPGGPEEKVSPPGCREPPVDSVPGERPLDRGERRGQRGNAELCFCMLSLINSTFLSQQAREEIKWAQSWK